MFLKMLPLFFLFTVSDAPRPYVDFDQVIEALRPHGQWDPIGEDRFVYRPNSPAPAWQPFRLGQWIYTDYGWTWKGSSPGTWATDHYGHWTKKHDSRWGWKPDGQWLAAPVEWLKSGAYVGWRPSKLDRFSNLLEPESERYSDPSEWSFILLDKMKGELKPDDFVDVAKATALLKNATPSEHIFVTYREIPRPGPALEIIKFDNDKLPLKPSIRELQDPNILPEVILPIDLHLFRPKFNQDNDGIMRRVFLFINPRLQQENDLKLKQTVGDQRTEEQKSKDFKKFESQLELERAHNEMLYR